MEQKKENLHAGHRERMREKLRAYGSAVMHSHELLEMLLFHLVPYKNTNPIARRLMLRFSTLDGVFSASREELLTVEGVGPKIADFLISVGKINPFDCDEELFCEKKPRFEHYEESGDYFVKYFNGSQKYEVVLLLLNNKMELLDCVTMYDTDYDSAAVKAEPFVSAALRVNAAVAVIAHNHPFGPLFPTPGDKETNRMIFDALEGAGISLVEHYVVSGDRFVGMMHGLSTAFSVPSFFERFHSVEKREEKPLSEVDGI